MNWKYIEKKYPKTFKLLLKSYDGYASNIDWFEILFNIRDLYDFFDDNDILIEISVGYDVETNYDWSYGIFDNEVNRLGECFKVYKTRIEAEIKGFTKAFEILENKL